MTFFICDECSATTLNQENDYYEHICDDCEQGAAEWDYERFCEDFHDGGATQFRSLRDIQIEAMKLK